jgi:WD40 repeat protein
MLTKAFRLFVSSTFADFAQERELLQSKVFPNLDVYCTAKGYQFHAVDLRWGVNKEAQLDQRTTEICLGEVAAAKRYPAPNLLIMVADWYGWVPLPFAIAQDEFEAVTAWLAEHDRPKAVDDLHKVYRLDENHLVPPGLAAAARSAGPVGAYTLRSREDEFRRLASPGAWKKAEDDWKELENELRSALHEAAAHLEREGRIGETARAKYFLSLTEQEIVHGLPGYNSTRGNGTQSASAQPDSVGAESIAWIREGAGVGPERRSSLLAGLLGSGARRPVDTDPAADPRVESLKAGIRRALPTDCVLSGRTTRNGGGRLEAAYLEDFAARIEHRLRAAIDEHIAERSEDGELVRERAQHEAFAEERRRVFRGRDGNLAAIEHYLTGDTSHPLVLYGPSGLGKSALIAQSITKASGRGVPVVYRFIGASADSADVRSLLVSIVEDLAAHGIVAKPEQWEHDDNKFDDQVRTLLGSTDTPAVVFIDALDQLKVPGQAPGGEKPYRLGWLPNMLLPRLKIVVSVLNDDAYKEDSSAYRALRRRLPDEVFLKTEPLTEHGPAILLALEASAQMRLRPSQRDYVLARFEAAAASPLYLRMAFEIARAWRSWDEPGRDRCVLAGDTAALIGQLIAELTSVHHHEPELVSRTLGYLVAAKDGLSAKELTEVLSADAGVMEAITRATEGHGVATPSVERHGVRRPKLPDSVWVRLHRQLVPLLVERRVDEQPLLGFFHRQVADIARERHYEPAKVTLHGALTDYFDAAIEGGADSAGVRPSAPAKAGADTKAPTLARDAGEVARARSTYTRRTLSELPYQLFHAGRRPRLDAILMSPDWMQQKLAAHGVLTLIDDYEKFGQGQMQNLIGRTLRLISGICTRDPRQLMPQLLGRLMTVTDAAAPAFIAAARRHVGRPSFLTQHPSLTPPGTEIARLEGHTGHVMALAVLPDGRLISGGEDGTIRLWDPASGAETARLKGHGGGVFGTVHALAVLPDGRLASGGDDGTIRLWDLARGVEIARLADRGGSVHGLAVLLDGRLASSGHDGTIRLWDPVRCVEIARLADRGDAVLALAVLPDGRLASGGENGAIRLWDTVQGAESARLEGHRGSARALAVLPDGRLASGDAYGIVRLWNPARGVETARLDGNGDAVVALEVLLDGRVASVEVTSIRLWDSARGAETTRLEGHDLQVRALAVLPDGRLASAGDDRTVRLWDPTRSAEIGRLAGHDWEVQALAVLPEGRIASAGTDGTVRLWDLASGAQIARLAGHNGAVMALAALPDGRLASGSRDRTVRLWDPVRGAETTRFDGHYNGLLAVLRDGRLASKDSDDTIRLWDPTWGGETERLDGHYNGVLAVLPDGRLASRSSDGTIHLWDSTRGAEIARLAGHYPWVGILVVLPGGRLAFGGADGTVWLWEVRDIEQLVLDLAGDPARGAETVRLEGHGDQVRALAALRDGRLASAGDDRTIRLWDLARGVEIARLEVDGAVTCLAALPDCRLVAGDALGRLHWLEIVE